MILCVFLRILRFLNINIYILFCLRANLPALAVSFIELPLGLLVTNWSVLISLAARHSKQIYSRGLCNTRVLSGFKVAVRCVMSLANNGTVGAVVAAAEGICSAVIEAPIWQAGSKNARRLLMRCWQQTHATRQDQSLPPKVGCQMTGTTSGKGGTSPHSHTCVRIRTLTHSTRC